jgi:outer membrane protein OmpA-like peptidoglycan-associated protein
MRMRTTILIGIGAALLLSSCAAPKRNLDFERLQGVWRNNTNAGSERELAAKQASDVDASFARYEASTKNAEREQLTYILERQIALFDAAVALAKDEKRSRDLILEKKNLEIALARKQAEASQAEADRLRLENIMQQEAADRALADAQAQVEAADLERQRQEQAAILAQQEAETARRLAEAQKREAELAAREAALRGDQVESLQRQMAGVREQKTTRGMALILGDAFFASGQTGLSNAGKNNLQPVLSFINKYPNKTVLIEGHSDGQGAADANQKISLKRAQSVRDSLIKLGADAQRLKAIGFGESQPIAGNDTEAGRAKNRRVEVVIEGVP